MPWLGGTVVDRFRGEVDGLVIALLPGVLSVVAMLAKDALMTAQMDIC